MQRGDFVGYCGPLSKALKPTMIFVTQRLATLLMGQLFPKPSLLQLLMHTSTNKTRTLHLTLLSIKRVVQSSNNSSPFFCFTHIMNTKSNVINNLTRGFQSGKQPGEACK